MSIWFDVSGESFTRPLSTHLFRLVESQQQCATLSLTDTLNEQSILEDILEESKPKAPPAAQSLHYLLMTPFRYPSLKHGSRYGDTTRRGIFYGAESKSTCLAECSYYRFVFLSGPSSLPPKGSIFTHHSMFSAEAKTHCGVNLCEAPFSNYLRCLTSKTDYRETQRLGSDMRDSQVEVFLYPSARDPESGVCGGVFEPSAIVSKSPDSLQNFVCDTRSDRVIFLSGKDVRFEFSRSVFEVEGSLPSPAA